MPLRIAKIVREGGRSGQTTTYLESTEPPPGSVFRDVNYQVARSVKIRYVDVREIVDCFIDEIAGHVARGHRVVFRGFGRFEAPRKGARMVWDLVNGVYYRWNGGNRLKFRPSNDWVSRINDEPIQTERRKYKQNWAARRKRELLDERE